MIKIYQSSYLWDARLSDTPQQAGFPIEGGTGGTQYLRSHPPPCEASLSPKSHPLLEPGPPPEEIFLAWRAIKLFPIA